MNYKHILLLSVLLLSYKLSQAQLNPEEQSKNFLQLYKIRSFASATDVLFTANPNAKEHQAAIDSLKKQIVQIENAFGACKGYELLTKTPAGNSMVMVTYLLKYEKNAVACHILFYKPDDAWQPLSVTLDRDMESQLIESSKTQVRNLAYLRQYGY